MATLTIPKAVRKGTAGALGRISSRLILAGRYGEVVKAWRESTGYKQLVAERTLLQCLNPWSNANAAVRLNKFNYMMLRHYQLQQ